MSDATIEPSPTAAATRFVDPMANITGREEPDPARLERKRVTLQRPALGSLPSPADPGP